mgnify:FL=1|jgi:hypothetical protein
MSDSFVSLGVLVTDETLTDKFVNEIIELANDQTYCEIILAHESGSQLSSKLKSLGPAKTPIIIIESSRNIKTWAYATLFAEQAVGDFVVWLNQFNLKLARELSTYHVDSDLEWISILGETNDYTTFNQRYGHTIVDSSAIGFVASRNAINVALSNDNNDHDLMVSLGLAFPDSESVKLEHDVLEGVKCRDSYTFAEMNRLINRHCQPYVPWLLRNEFALTAGVVFLFVTIMTSFMCNDLNLALIGLVLYAVMVLCNAAYDIIDLMKVNIAYASGKKVSGTARVEVI